MNVKNVGELVDLLLKLPRSLEIVGCSDGYEYPTDISAKKGTYNKKESEFGGSDECLIISANK